MVTELLRHPVFKNGVISLVGFVITGAVGYVFQFFISRRLPVATYGEFQSLVSLLGLLGVGSAALSYFVIAHTSVFAHHKDTVANQQFVRWLKSRLKPAFILLIAVFAVISFPLKSALHLSDIWGVVIVGVAAVLSLQLVIYTGIFTGWQNFVAVYGLGIAGSVLKLAAAFGILAWLASASAAAGVLLASALGTLLLAHVWSSRTFKPHHVPLSTMAGWRKKYFVGRSLRRDVQFIAVFTFLILWLQNADVLLVKHLASAEMAGHYGALNLLGKIILWVNLGIVSVVLPIVVAGEHAQAAHPRVRLYAYGMVVGISAVVIAAYLWLPGAVIRFTVGAQYVHFASSLGVIGLMNTLLSLLLLEANFTLARRDARSLVILTAAALVFAIGIAGWPVSITSVAVSGVIAFGAGFLGLLVRNVTSGAPAVPADVPIPTSEQPV